MSTKSVEPYRVPLLHISIYRAGSFCGTEVFAQSRVFIGRRPEADINLVCETISRNHAVICIRHDGFVVEDLGSRNGTFVNGHRVRRSFFGFLDDVTVGSFRLKFRLVPYADTMVTWRESTTIVERPEFEDTVEVTAMPALLSIPEPDEPSTTLDPRADTILEDYDLSLSLVPDEDAIFPLADLLEPEDMSWKRTTEVRLEDIPTVEDPFEKEDPATKPVTRVTKAPAKRRTSGIFPSKAALTAQTTAPEYRSPVEPWASGDQQASPGIRDRHPPEYAA
jgi:predicted component of type VI protein secretion system